MKYLVLLILIPTLAFAEPTPIPTATPTLELLIKGAVNKNGSRIIEGPEMEQLLKEDK